VAQAQLLYYYNSQHAGPTSYGVRSNLLPTGVVAYPYQYAAHSAPLRQAPVAAAPVLPATRFSPVAVRVAPVQPAGGVSPALLEATADQLVDTAIITLNQQLPAINEFFASVSSNKLLTKLLVSAQKSGSSCAFDPLALGAVANKLIGTIIGSRAEMIAVVESVQTMARAGAADDAPGAVRAMGSAIDAIAPLGPKLNAVFPGCAGSSLPAIAGVSQPAPAAPVTAAQAADQLKDVARTLTALASTSFVRDETARANLTRLAKMVDVVGTVADRFSERNLGPVCADNLLNPEVFRAVMATINDVTAVFGGGADNKLMEMVELIKEGIRLIEDLDGLTNQIAPASRSNCQRATLKDLSRSINEIADLTAVVKS